MKWKLSAHLFLTGLCSLSHCLAYQYFFSELTLSWSKAQQYCREMYTDLATVSNNEDMRQLVNTVQATTGGFKGKAWIGLHDNLTSWRWSFSEVQSTFRNWDFGQPDNYLGDQMCVKMWGGGVWDDTSCPLRNPFICENVTSSRVQDFILVDKDMSWSDAQVYCRRTYTDLASVRDESDNQRIQRLAQNRSVWIGLYRMREWSDRSNSTYRYWDQGQPDNVGGLQACTAADLSNSGLWSDEACSASLAFICYGDSETPVSSTTTTVTPNHMTTTEGHSTSPEQPSATAVDQTSAETSTKPPSITTATPSQTQTSFSTEMTSRQQLSTSVVDPSTSSSEGALNISATNQPSTSSHLSTEMTSSEPTQDVDQTATGTETPTKPLSSTTMTTVTPDKLTTMGDSPSSEITSPQQPSNSVVDPSTSSSGGSLNISATNQPSTSSHLSTEMTSSEPTSTQDVDQTATGTETPTKPLSSTTMTTVTPDKITTMGDSPGSEITSPQQPSNSVVDQSTSSSVTPSTRTLTDSGSAAGLVTTDRTPSEGPSTITGAITHQTLKSTIKMTPTDGSYSTGIEDSSQQYSTPNVDQKTSIPEHAVILRVKFTSMTPLSEDDIQKLVLGKFRDLLISMGLPKDITLGLSRTIKQ